MTYPAHDADLRQLVATMRELGVTEAFGVRLGPQPVAEVEPLPEKVTRELAQVASRREQTRDMLYHLGADAWSDEQLDEAARSLGLH